MIFRTYFGHRLLCYFSFLVKARTRFGHLRKSKQTETASMTSRLRQIFRISHAVHGHDDIMTPPQLGQVIVTNLDTLSFGSYLATQSGMPNLNLKTLGLP